MDSVMPGRNALWISLWVRLNRFDFQGVSRLS
jgi:hypothetical protein